MARARLNNRQSCNRYISYRYFHVVLYIGTLRLLDRRSKPPLHRRFSFVRAPNRPHAAHPGAFYAPLRAGPNGVGPEQTSCVYRACGYNARYYLPRGVPRREQTEILSEIYPSVRCSPPGRSKPRASEARSVVRAGSAPRKRLWPREGELPSRARPSLSP
jgi:hypothetical protein